MLSQKSKQKLGRNSFEDQNDEQKRPLRTSGFQYLPYDDAGGGAVESGGGGSVVPNRTILRDAATI